MKLDKKVLANAVALWSAIVWVVCSIFVMFFPRLSLLTVGWWMHGMNMSAMGPWNPNLSNILLGGITFVLLSWAGGWLFGWTWEWASKKK